ncbi:MAG: translocation/assembly module TamB, partial [Duncaniella sp.]|nr:translocation/assembly module TamB [Duncaniella sp.]
IGQIADVKLQDWLSINPFAPPVKGDLSADIHVQYRDAQITGTGTIGLADLYYGKERVGTFDLGVDVSSTLAGKLMADVSLMVDSVKTVTARGVLNDSTMASPFLLDFNMIKFPLAVANPFLPTGTARLRGVLNGAMTITGDMASPIFNGYLEFDSAAVTASMLGTEFRFPAEKIPVDSNIISFKDFNIMACNANPLTINGTVDVRRLSNVSLDLDLKARNMQIVNSDRPRGAEVYGKAFVDLDAKAGGNMQRIAVDADVALLSGSNVTYVLTSTSSEISSGSDEDMVRFVNFADTAQTETVDSVPPAMMMWVNADISIREGTTVNVDLNTNGSNRVQVKGNGDLDFSMSPLNGMRMTGRLNIDGGFARYSIPPVLSEKNFAFEGGSYVAFNGDVMNPVLNVRGVDVIKANVTQSWSN